MREAEKISNLPDVALAFFRGSHPTKKGRQGETSSLAGTIEVTGYSFSEVFSRTVSTFQHLETTLGF